MEVANAIYIYPNKGLERLMKMLWEIQCDKEDGGTSLGKAKFLQCSAYLFAKDTWRFQNEDL